ncbi:hypothetical protein INT46_010165 [Mucor plumbeus]|uniref:Tc1-like transposase DDE domain-containing protein n=1 Tax=Mucor plumbeus TaxID=97098 RepID=A0A8H7QLX0_9FUNG|nr:hypothetical protein INT46_010165 [Mucor plumbeus]
MARTLPYDVQDSTRSLLLSNTLLCSIKKMYPTVGMAILSKYRREFLAGAQASTSGRSSDGPGYGTSIIDGTIESNEYVEILKTSLMQTLDYDSKQPSQSSALNPIEHIWGDLRRNFDAYPKRPATNMPRRIEAVIKSRGGAAKYQ